MSVRFSHSCVAEDLLSLDASLETPVAMGCDQDIGLSTIPRQEVEGDEVWRPGEKQFAPVDCQRALTRHKNLGGRIAANQAPRNT